VTQSASRTRWSSSRILFTRPSPHEQARDHQHHGIGKPGHRLGWGQRHHADDDTHEHRVADRAEAAALEQRGPFIQFV
jgi:hypothetical protein